MSKQFGLYSEWNSEPLKSFRRGINTRNIPFRRIILAAQWRMWDMYCHFPYQREMVVMKMMMVICIRELGLWVTWNKYLVSRIQRTWCWLAWEHEGEEWIEDGTYFCLEQTGSVYVTYQDRFHWGEKHVLVTLGLVLIFYSCSDKLSQAQWLKTIQVYYLTIL